MAEVENTPKKDEVKIEDEVPELEPTDEPPALENAPASGDDSDAKGGKQSRSEKKSRKEMQKLKLKPVPGIIRVTVKKSKNVSFCCCCYFISLTESNRSHPCQPYPSIFSSRVFINNRRFFY
jgi:hypothetical protein